MIRALVADDHAVVRRGLRELLAESREVAVTGEAGNAPPMGGGPPSRGGTGGGGGGGGPPTRGGSGGGPPAGGPGGAGDGSDGGDGGDGGGMSGRGWRTVASGAPVTMVAPMSSSASTGRCA